MAAKATEKAETAVYHDFPTAEVFEPLLVPARFKGACGGRGAGKSQFFADLLIARCLNRPTRAVCLREVQLSLAQSSKLLLEDKLRARGLAPGRFQIQDKMIRAPHGGFITFQGMQNHTADSIRSLEGFDIAWTDEAHKLSAYSLGLLRPTFRKDDSELWFSWNPQHPTDPVDALFRGRVPPPDSVVVETCWDDNPWLTDALREEMEYDRSRDIDRYRHVWLGEYQAHSEARVFRNWRIEEFPTPASIAEWEDIGLKKRFYFGCDWGFASSPTVLVRCWLHGKILFIDHEAWDVGCEIDRTPDLFDIVPESRAWPITADSANPQAISYMRRHGFPKIEASIKGKNSVEEGVEFMRAHDIVVHPRCEHVIDELTNYAWEVDEKTEKVLPVLADRKNHTIDSVRYALESLRRKGSPAGMGTW
jgi:phage terminase large subunit